jgi:hypothetical protein
VSAHTKHQRTPHAPEFEVLWIPRGGDSPKQILKLGGAVPGWAERQDNFVSQRQCSDQREEHFERRSQKQNSEKESKIDVGSAPPEVISDQRYHTMPNAKQLERKVG